jgi:hypothetical protein
MSKDTPTPAQRRFIHALGGQRAQLSQQTAGPPQQNAAPARTAAAVNRSTPRRYSDEESEDLYRDEEPEEQAGPSVPAEKEDAQGEPARLEGLQRRRIKADIQRWFATQVEQALPALKKMSNGEQLDANRDVVDQSVRALCKQTLEMVKHSRMLCRGKPFKGATMSGGAVRLLEQLGKHAGMPADLRDMMNNVLAQACSALAEEAHFRLHNLPEQNEQAQLEILQEFGGCKPPREKGMSDSFVISSPEGKPAYFFKPIEGEAYPGVDWPEGGGAAREALTSRINELFKDKLKIDFGVPHTDVARLEDESFRSGSLSQSPSRVGVVVSAVPLQEGDPPNARALFCPSGENLAAASHIDENYHEYMQALNKQDCKNIALLNFVTLNLDANVGNVLLTNCGTAPGATRLTPIDAGRAFPSPETFRRGAATMNSTVGYDEVGSVVEGQSFIFQTPAASESFEPATVHELATMDVDAMVAGMRSAYSEVTDKAPEMGGSIDPGTFDLMRKSLLFLQEAARSTTQLTLREIAAVYAEGFTEIVDAPDDNATGAAIASALQAAVALKQAGGNYALLQRGFIPDVVGTMTLQQKADALQRGIDQVTFQGEDYQRLQADLHDIGSYLVDSTEKITNELTQPFSEENYKFLNDLAFWKQQGGDPRFKKMCEGNEETYQLEVRRPIHEKRFGSLNNAEYLMTLGGVEAFKRLIGEEAFDRECRGKDLATQGRAFEEALKAARTKE